MYRVPLDGDVSLHHAIDVGFLHGRATPTALVLADPRQTWPGRSDRRQPPPDTRWNPSTCEVGALVLSPLPRTGALLWRRQGLSSNSTASDSNSNSSSNSNSNSLGLPSNSTALLPLPLPLGGALVVHSHGVALNGEARCEATPLVDGAAPRVALSLHSGELDTLCLFISKEQRIVDR
ncbi:hypothetical protein EMIHUDRAFT_208061 [Emiliania huxleyi CCMP1516]|uniref:Uncharacterized protein n=2 Tax=Emiliania huxleyi TaxID=2903 RepID=A0A0D3JBV3_EMIH1|nr:hypothetical protein EMIHUDRAFT_208061 [Emiliania huxleyi CCMP1516]EOD20988.1 hypothetical protein EMIHUDRAFT_208061 [Emiliania huxleyi CCMP1516]|eukprot:XP_005773417.1 hypothetical protein EMIHUDRAFT_208061 [Emiliania huxleyi CCMP1516]